MPGPVGGWWLHPNEGNRAPNCHIAIDCESWRNPGPDGECHTFRLAVAVGTKRATADDAWSVPLDVACSDARTLWSWVAGFHARNGRTIVVAHNLAYDLRISEALTILPEMGWTPRPPMMDRNRVLFKWTRKDRTLVMVDSFNWLPTNLDDIGGRMGLRKLTMPPESATDQEWFTYCKRDAYILFDAWMRLVDFVKRENLGVWRPTGAGQAMNAYRHRFLTHRMLVHADPEARTAERESAWAGRAEAWRHGEVPDGPFYEWDYELGYARILQECAVPTIYRGKAANKSRWNRWWDNPRWAYLFRCHVETEVPCVPARHAGGILWPVGSFDTTLWGHEARLVLEKGGSVDIQEAWLYDRAPALRAFSEWCLAYLSLGPSLADPVCQMAVKHFTRAIVGKFGTQFRDWVHVGDDSRSDLRLWSVVDTGDPDAGDILHLGHRVFQQGERQESEQAIPSVLAFVQAEMRVRLWRAMDMAGLDNVAYVDTDGLIVNSAGNQLLRAARIPHLRVKRTWEHVEIMGPRQLVLDGQLRAAGIPKRGTWEGSRKWNAEVWEEMPTSLRHGESGSVRVKPRAYRLSGSERRRAFLPGGLTAARTLPTP